MRKWLKEGGRQGRGVREGEELHICWDVIMKRYEGAVTTNAPFPPYVSAGCQRLPPAFFLAKNNKPMKQPARRPGVRTHRGCIL